LGTLELTKRDIFFVLHIRRDGTQMVDDVILALSTVLTCAAITVVLYTPPIRK